MNCESLQESRQAQALQDASFLRVVAAHPLQRDAKISESGLGRQLEQDARKEVERRRDAHAGRHVIEEVVDDAGVDVHAAIVETAPGVHDVPVVYQRTRLLVQVRVLKVAQGVLVQHHVLAHQPVELSLKSRVRLVRKMLERDAENVRETFVQGPGVPAVLQIARRLNHAVRQFVPDDVQGRQGPKHALPCTVRRERPGVVRVVQIRNAADAVENVPVANLALTQDVFGVQELKVQVGDKVHVHRRQVFGVLGAEALVLGRVLEMGRGHQERVLGLDVPKHGFTVRAGARGGERGADIVAQVKVAQGHDVAVAVVCFHVHLGARLLREARNVQLHVRRVRQRAQQEAGTGRGFQPQRLVHRGMQHRDGHHAEVRRVQQVRFRRVVGDRNRHGVLGRERLGFFLPPFSLFRGGLSES